MCNKIEIRFTNTEQSFFFFFDKIKIVKDIIYGEYQNKNYKIADISQKASNVLGNIITYNSVYIFPETKKLIGAEDIEVDEAWVLKIQPL